MILKAYKSCEMLPNFLKKRKCQKANFVYLLKRKMQTNFVCIASFTQMHEEMDASHELVVKRDQ